MFNNTLLYRCLFGLALLAVIFMVAGCCSGRRCAPCEVTDFRVAYGTTGNDTCPLDNVEDLRISALGVGNDSLIYHRPPQIDYCYVAMEYEDNAYWVIASDTLGISDTLTFTDLAWSDPCSGCCCCPQKIVSASFTLRGIGYSQDGEIDSDRLVVREL